MDKGYWFLGNDGYTYIPFWEGNDWQRKIRNIGFVVDNSTKNSWIELSAKGDEAKSAFIRIIAQQLNSDD